MDNLSNGLEEFEPSPAGKRLKLIREATGLSQIDFAESIGYSQRKVSRIETGQNLDRKFAKAVAMKYSIDEEWILFNAGDAPDLIFTVGGGREEMRFSRKKDTLKIPILDIDRPELAIQENLLDNVFEEMIFPRRLFEVYFPELKGSSNGLALTWVQGDVMSPSIGAGDLVLSRVDHKYSGDGIYVIQLYDGLCVRRLQRKSPTEFLLLSDNNKYLEQNVKFQDENKFELIGRVIWVSHKMRI